MGKRIIITEEQYQRALREGVAVVKAEPSKQGETPEAAVKNALCNVKNVKCGVRIEIPPQQQQTMEGRVITKRQLKEERLKHLKQNSNIYKLSDFMRKVKR